MLKFFYKTFLIALLSGSLTLAHSPAYAQAQMNKAEASGMTRDSNGVLKKTETQTIKAPEENDMLSSITMLVIGAIGTRMAMNYRPITTDVMIAAAGAAAFIAGEVMSTMGAKKKLEDATIEITKSSDGAKDQAQIQRLQDLRKSYEEMKKSIGTKKMLQITAAAAFAGAAAMAVYMSFQEEAMAAACEAAVKTAKGSLSTCNVKETAAAAQDNATGNSLAAGTYTAAQAPPFFTKAQNETKEAMECTKCEAELGQWLAKFKMTKTKEETPGPSTPKATEAKTANAVLESGSCKTASGIAAKGIAMGVDGACKPAFSLKKIFHMEGNPIKTSSNGNDLLNKILFGGDRAVAGHYEMYQSKENYSLLDNAVDFVFPRVNAGMMPLLGLGAGAAASYFLLDGTLGTMVDTLVHVPLNRAMLFGVLAGLAFMASRASQNQMDQIDANIKKIDEILASMNALEKGIKTNNVNDQQIKLAGLNTNQTQDMQLNPNPAVKTGCIVGSGSTNCKSVSDTMQSMPGFSDLPDSFKSIASQSAKLGDGLSGTNSISGSTLATASSLAGKQNAINKLLKASQKKLNDKLAANGKKPIDFDKEQKNLLGKLNSQAGKALKSGGMSPAGFLSSTGSLPISSGGVGAGDADGAKGSGKKALSAIPGSGSYGGSAPSSRDKDFDMDFKEAGAEGAADGAIADATPEEGKFDIGTNDINTDSGESIFQLISNRYIKSGYPKLLEEIPAKN